MENPHHLRDAYRFPGLDPAASVHDCPGEVNAIVLPLRRRRKKRSVATADKPIPAFTINVRG
jgi:hypothetical protein